ncbi:hypothetical protein DI005_20025 [Prauserella sp. PE36]|nr:hypothetical protein DI005_20025 [Prauserella sp. PE36]
MRQHLPAGEAEQNARRKARDGAKAVAYQRIRRTSDPMQQLDAARDYVRSAAAKYSHGPALNRLVNAMLEIGDEIFRDGTRRRRS